VSIKYPMAGQSSEEPKIGIYSLKNNKTVYINPRGNKDDYFTNLCFTPDEKYILVAEVNRDQNHMHLNVYDSKTGLITEGEFKGQKSTAKITVDGKQTEVGTGVGLSSAFMGGKTLEPNNKGDDTWRGKQGRKWGIFGHDKGGEANAAYDKNYTDKGKENPTLKALLNNLRQRDLDPEKLHVDVGGKVYTLAEAIDKFPELLSTGKIRFLDGGIEGETTGNVAGSTIAMDSKAESKALADAGKGTGVSGTYTTSEWQEKHGQDYTGDKDKKEGGGGTLELTPAAKKLVYLLDGTGANSPPAS